MRAWESCLFGQWHRIAEILFVVSNSAAVKTYIFRGVGNLFDLVELSFACQDADMTLMVSFACIFAH